MRVFKIVGWIFAPLGLAALLGSGIWVQVNHRFLSNAHTTTGTVIELGHRPHANGAFPIVRFSTEDDQEIVFSGGTVSSPPAHAVGDRVDVAYSPDNPNQAHLLSFAELWLGPTVFGFLGLIFSALGGAFLFAVRRRQQLYQWLSLHGRPIEARWVSVERNRRIRVNGRSPYQIFCQWENPSTGEQVVFASENIWTDPQPLLDQQPLHVVIDPNDPRRYRVDLSFIPKAER